MTRQRVGSCSPDALFAQACSTAPMETLVHGYQGIWQITSGNFNGYLRVNGETVLVGTYVTADEAAKARDRFSSLACGPLCMIEQLHRKFPVVPHTA